MLIHIVCWKYKQETTEEQRSEHRRRLRALGEAIPELRNLDVGKDILGLDRSFDTGLVAHFVGRDGLEAYTIHPDHQEVAAMGKRIAERVVSVDFVTDGSE